jgi:hypothetical protein
MQQSNFTDLSDLITMRAGRHVICWAVRPARAGSIRRPPGE